MTPSVSLLFPVSGLIGVLRSPVFPLWLSGGTKGKVSLRDLLLDIAVFVLLSGHNTVASCLGWRTTQNVVSMLVLYLVWGPTLAELARMDIEVARGAQVRARARWVEEGETSSAFFLRLEKKRAADRSVAALVRLTDPLYPVMMTCVVFFHPFMRPCLLLKLPILL